MGTYAVFKSNPLALSYHLLHKNPRLMVLRLVPAFVRNNKSNPVVFSRCRWKFITCNTRVSPVLYPYIHLLTNHLSRRENPHLQHPCFLPLLTSRCHGIIQNISGCSTTFLYVVYLQMTLWKWSDRMRQYPYLVGWLKSVLCQLNLLFDF